MGHDGSKEYYLDKLLGFVVQGVYNNGFSCKKLANWINSNINLLIMS